mgnify:CR=1 FL=1
MASEPPYAEPHVGWCGEGERETRPYPIGRSRYRGEKQRLP